MVVIGGMLLQYMMCLCVIWRVNCVRIRKRKGAIMKGGVSDLVGPKWQGVGEG